MRLGKARALAGSITNCKLVKQISSLQSVILKSMKAFTRRWLLKETQRTSNLKSNYQRAN